MAETSLDGVVVIERAGRLAGAIAGTLLAELGAMVIRVADPRLALPAEPDAWRNHPAALAGKQRLTLSNDPAIADSQWDSLLDRADAVIYSPPLPAAGDRADALIRCDVSSFGIDGADGLPDDCSEVILQALGGMMSTTGADGGPPELTGAPLVEFFTGANCATAIAAALRSRDNGGPGQRIDIAAYDSSVALVGAYAGHIQAGEGHGLRAGSRHPLCSPWNAYKTVDGWVLICSSTEPQWRRVLDVIGQPGLKDDPRFATMPDRKQHQQVVDDLVTAWTDSITTQQAVDALEDAGVPVGPIVTIPGLIAQADSPPARTVQMPDGEAVITPNSILVMDGSPPINPDAISNATDDVESTLHAVPPRAAHAPKDAGSLPLAGIRVVEIALFTAGPLGGRYLTDLGAEVIKVEQPGGETGRIWQPNFGGVSGYFSTYNAGKRSVILDLQAEADKAALEDLIGSSDVLLQNLKAGALERLGFGPGATRERHPGLIYCSVSGYGSTGSKAPALDTVIQAKSGLMALIGKDGDPIKAGLSVADLLAAHLSPLAILAALRHRDRTGTGQHIDLSMRDALAWTTQLTWPDGAWSLPPYRQIACADGWVVAEAAPVRIDAALRGVTPDTENCADMLAQFATDGIPAAKVLELDEIFTHPMSARRNLFGLADTEGGVPAPVLAAPYALCGTPLSNDRPVPAAGADNGMLKRG
jgi:crotonobetainyl-CoA:carnitine CoA-transferase CaiB-like acyl-CoA transferase